MEGKHRDRITPRDNKPHLRTLNDSVDSRLPRPVLVQSRQRFLTRRVFEEDYFAPRRNMPISGEIFWMLSTSCSNRNHYESLVVGCKYDVSSRGARLTSKLNEAHRDPPSLIGQQHVAEFYCIMQVPQLEGYAQYC